MAATSKLQRIRVLEEVTIATDMSSSPGIGTFLDARAHVSWPQPTITMLADDSLRQRSYQDRLRFIGPKPPAPFALKMPLVVSGLPLNTAAATPATPRTALGRILKAVLGGWASDKGDVSVAGSTPTVINGTTGARFTAGRALCVPTGAGSSYEMGEIASIAGANYTMKLAFSSSLGNAQPIINTETFYQEDPANNKATLQMLVESPARKMILMLLGMQAAGGFTIDLPPSGIPTVTFSMQALDWLEDSELAAPQGGSAIAAASYATDADPPVFYKSAFLWQTAGSAQARQTLDIHSITVKPDIGFEVIPAPDGPNGARGWFPLKKEPICTIEFVVRVDDAAPYDRTFYTQWKARTAMQAFIQVGNVSGFMHGLSFPNLQIVNVQPAEAGGMRGWKITAYAYEDAFATDQSTAIRRAWGRWHQG